MQQQPEQIQPIDQKSERKMEIDEEKKQIIVRTEATEVYTAEQVKKIWDAFHNKKAYFAQQLPALQKRIEEADKIALTPKLRMLEKDLENISKFKQKDSWKAQLDQLKKDEEQNLQHIEELRLAYTKLWPDKSIE